MRSTSQRPANASGTFRIGSELEVSRLGFGSMRLTGRGVWGPPEDKEEAIAVLRRALDLGINLIDTADSYGPEVAESLIAEALYPYPQDLVIATKGGLVRTGPNQWPADGRPEHLREALEGSLKRLRLDHIDVYQFHRPDTKVPFEDSVGEIARMQDEGKIRCVGLSNVTIDQLARAQEIVRVVTVQNHYNIADRKSERMTVSQSEQMIDLCEEQGIGYIPWAPLGFGDLAKSGTPLDEIAREHHARPAQVALAWLLKRSSTMLPIPGTSKVEHLEQNVAAATLELSQDEYEALDQGGF
jgi:pyridoxine 4-dehydrogenase